jgi:hypothetical protein
MKVPVTADARRHPRPARVGRSLRQLVTGALPKATNVDLNVHEAGGGELRLNATRRDVEILEISEQTRERAGIIFGRDAQPKKGEGFGFLDSHLISSSDPVLEVRTQTRPCFRRKPGT